MKPGILILNPALARGAVEAWSVHPVSTDELLMLPQSYIWLSSTPLSKVSDEDLEIVQASASSAFGEEVYVAIKQL